MSGVGAAVLTGEAVAVVEVLAKIEPPAAALDAGVGERWHRVGALRYGEPQHVVGAERRADAQRPYGFAAAQVLAEVNPRRAFPFIVAVVGARMEHGGVEHPIQVQPNVPREHDGVVAAGLRCDTESDAVLGDFAAGTVIAYHDVRTERRNGVCPAVRREPGNRAGRGRLRRMGKGCELRGADDKHGYDQ